MGKVANRQETLGRLVRETWVKWAREQPAPKPAWLASWDELDQGQREVDTRIGEAVAAAERERISAGLDAIAERYKSAGVFARCVVTDVRKLLAGEKR